MGWILAAVSHRDTGVSHRYYFHIAILASDGTESDRIDFLMAPEAHSGKYSLLIPKCSAVY
jgi:hypothetical protein